MRRTLLSVLTLAAAVLGIWVALTSLAPASWVATWAPCPRNWGWLPAWLPRASPLADERFAPAPDLHGKVCYGRPSLRGRTMIGGEAVPYGRLWRTGANEPTTLHLDGPARLGPLDLTAGSYALYTVPEPAAWEVVVTRATRQWGLESLYDETARAREVGRFQVPVQVLDTPVETLTIRAVPAGSAAVDLLLEWQTTRIRLPLESPFAGE
ncbi:MAG: hypothetical protein AMXMBFR36_07510 [Acidobacteriota bacterium]